MSGLPRGWQWDYDGTRWFYKYIATGHVQYHFPKEGDEFPDFIDATSPAPQLAPEERLESQQQVRRRTSHHAARGGDVDKWAGRMVATALPVSSVWEEEPRREREAFQPESLMFLGPGTYVDISPLMEEEDEVAKRTVVAGGSPSASGGAPTPADASKTASPQNQHATPDVRGEKEEQEVAVHMLDGREMPLELPADGGRFNPVGVMAEMATGETGRARVETHPDPVELGDSTVLAPIETAEVQEVTLEVLRESSPAAKEHVPGSEAEVPRQQHQEPKQQEKTGERTQEERPETQGGSTRLQEDQQQRQADATGLGRPFKIARKPTKTAANGMYQPYKPGQTTTEEQSPTATKRRSWQAPPRRNESIMMHLAASSKNGERQLDPDSVPPALSARRASVSPERQPQKAPKHVVEGALPEQDDEDLSPMPLALKPVRNGPTRNSIERPSQAPPTVDMLPTEPLGGGGALTEPRPASGVTKVPSVLKPARGRAPLLSSKPEATSSPSHGRVLRKSYLQAGEPEPPVRTPDIDVKKYVPYTGTQQSQEGNSSAAQVVRVNTTETPSPASAMPVVETRPESGTGAHPQRALPPDSRHGLDVKLADTPTAQLKPSTMAHASLSSTSVAPGTPEAKVVPSGSSPVDKVLPAGPTHESVPSPMPSIKRETYTNSLEEVSLIRPRSASSSSGAPAQAFSPIDRRRRGSPVVSPPQSMDGATVFTPSPESRTPPSATHSVTSLTARSSGLRHSISGDPVPAHTAEAVVSPVPPVPRKIPLEQERDSYFPAQGAAVQESPRRHSVPAGPVSSAIQQQPALAQPTGSFQPQEALRPQTQEQPVQGLQHPQSSNEELVPQIGTPQHQAPSTPGHILTRIEEQHEEDAHTGTVDAIGPAAPLARRPSASSSIQQSPKPAGRQSPGSASVASSASSIHGTVAVAQQAQRPVSQVQVVHVQSPGAGGRPIQHRPLSQGHIPPQTQVPPQGQGLPQGQVPPTQRQIPVQGQPHPVLTMSLPGHAHPGKVPPGSQHGPGHPPQPWSPQMPQSMAPTAHPGALPRAPTWSPSAKEKENKWTKWFKGSKAPKPTQPPQPQYQYYAPVPGQLPLPGGPAGPPLGWAPAPYAAQPAVWHPGYQPVGPPLAGVHQQHPPPGLIAWQPIPGAPQGPYHQPPGTPTTLNRSNTVSSASTNSSIPPGRLSLDYQRTQQPQTPAQFPGGPVRQPGAAAQQPGVPVQRPQASSQPQAPPAQPMVVHQGAALGSHPPSGSPFQNGATASPRHSHVSSISSLSSQQNIKVPVSAHGDAVTAPQPLFSKPAAGPTSQGARPVASPAPQSGKRTNVPSADYAGGDWGR